MHDHYFDLDFDFLLIWKMFGETDWIKTRRTAPPTESTATFGSGFHFLKEELRLVTFMTPQTIIRHSMCQSYSFVFVSCSDFAILFFGVKEKLSQTSG